MSDHESSLLGRGIAPLAGRAVPCRSRKPPPCALHFEDATELGDVNRVQRYRICIWFGPDAGSDPIPQATWSWSCASMAISTHASFGTSWERAVAGHGAMLRSARDATGWV
jgi:hypothetical protein